jgi:hypothetical protein
MPKPPTSTKILGKSTLATRCDQLAKQAAAWLGEVRGKSRLPDATPGAGANLA